MRLTGLIAMMALAFASCSKPTTPATVTETAPAAPEPAPTTPVETISQTPPAAAPAPSESAPAPELAPEGVFYLLAAARVETGAGVHGLPPGTGVKLIRP